MRTNDDIPTYDQSHIHHDSDYTEKMYAFACEFPDATCITKIYMTVPEYERLHHMPGTYTACPNHEAREFEKIVTRHPGFTVVKELYWTYP